MPIIQEKIMPDSVMYTNALLSYNALDISEFHHRINHSKLFANKPITLKTEWRFNGENHQTLLKPLKYWYKNIEH